MPFVVVPHHRYPVSFSSVRLRVVRVFRGSSLRFFAALTNRLIASRNASVQNRANQIKDAAEIDGATVG